MICYCFEYTAEDIQQDYMKNSRSTIMEKIQAEKKFGNCQCTVKNPKGHPIVPLSREKSIIFILCNFNKITL